MPTLEFNDGSLEFNDESNDNSNNDIISIKCIYCNRLVPDPLLEKHMGEYHNWTSELVSGK